MPERIYFWWKNSQKSAKRARKMKDNLREEKTNHDARNPTSTEIPQMSSLDAHTETHHDFGRRSAIFVTGSGNKRGDSVSFSRKTSVPTSVLIDMMSWSSSFIHIHPICSQED